MSLITNLWRRARQALMDEPVAGALIRPGHHADKGALVAGLVLASVLGGFLFALTQPASAANLYFLKSWLFWALHGLAGFGFVLVCEFVFLRTSWKRPVRVAITLGLLPFFLAPVSLFLDSAFETVDPDTPASGGLLRVYLFEVIDVAPLAIIVVGTALFLMNRLLPGGHPSPPQTDIPNTPPLHQTLDGLPSALGDDLIRLSAQDHYTEAVTTEGTHLLTARFSDCIEQLDTYDGVQTHRSHWVSLKHVRDLKASGSAYECVLSNSERIPISRRRYAALKHLLRARVG